VEQHFIKKRELMPEYKHGFYWIGYKAAGNPAFDWVDPQARGVAYTHWGTYLRRLPRFSRSTSAGLLLLPMHKPHPGPCMPCP
jgi:hypothetical protein